MEIDPTQRHNADLIGKLRQQYASGQSVLDALPATQRQPITHGIQTAHVIDPPPAATDYSVQTDPIWTQPERDTFAQVRVLRRPIRRRRRLVWRERWLLAALRLTFRIERWWQRRQQRKHRLRHRQQRARPR
ncbi:MAG: hypothetical protein LHW57_04320 [Candidatus Cloacimonetes bacterium]|nr:hypothetical protein [Candidatus Cloacimonadota bacterium]